MSRKKKYGEETVTRAFRIPVTQIENVIKLVNNYLEKFKTNDSK